MPGRKAKDEKAAKPVKPARSEIGSDQLSDEELDKAAGGDGISFTYTKIEQIYTPQKP